MRLGGHRWSAHLAQLCTRRPYIALGFGLLVTLITTPFALRIGLNSNLLALLPDNAPIVHALKRILEKRGGEGDLMVMIESPKFKDSVRYAESLLKRVKTLSWVGRAVITRDNSFFEKNKLLYINLPDLKQIHSRVDARLRWEKLHKNPAYIDLEDEGPPSLDFTDIEKKYRHDGPTSRYFRSEDGSVLLMVVYPRGVTGNVSFARRITSELETLVASADPKPFNAQMKTSVGGTFKNRVLEYERIIRDVKASGTWVGLGLLLLILAYFRQWASPLVIGIPLAMSLSWTFAITQVAIGGLNLITVFLVIVLMGLGIDFGIHILARFNTERMKKNGIKFSLENTLSGAGRAALIGALTTAAGFFALIHNDFKGFSDFGFIAGTGLLMSAIAFLTVLPAMLAITDKAGLLRPRAPSSLGLSTVLLRGPRLAVVVLVIGTLSALLLSPRVSFEYDNGKLRSQIASRTEFNRKMRKVFTRRRDPAAILTDDAQEAASVVRLLEARMRAKGEQSPILEVRSIHSLVPEQQDEKLQVISKLRDSLEQNEEFIPEDEKARLDKWRRSLDVKALSIADLPQKVTRPFRGDTTKPGQLVYVYQRFEPLDLRNTLAFADTLTDIKVQNKPLQAASEALVYAAMIRLIKDETPSAVLISVLALVLLLWLDLRSLSQILIVLCPLAVGVLWMLGAMTLIPLRFNLYNIAVLPSIFGLGIDGGVHIYHRARALGWSRMGEVLDDTGSAVTACTLTSLIGFGSMLATEHPGLRSIGWLAVLGLGMCLLGSVVFLPNVLAFFSSKIKGRLHQGTAAQHVPVIPAPRTPSAPQHPPAETRSGSAGH